MADSSETNQTTKSVTIDEHVLWEYKNIQESAIHLGKGKIHENTIHLW